MVAVGDVHQLCRDAQVLSGFSNASFEHRLHAKLLSDIANIEILTLEREGGRSGDHAQIPELRKRIDEFLRHAVTEILLVLVRTHICERQDGYR